ncbi:heterokaryon incompatibility protein-domain-containing protein, partial [Leptodontidium sp. 2 PMI_412]
YLALSHPWGKESPNHRHFKSNRENIKNRMTKIKDIELPLNFRHAVQIARRLGVNYLWIDSICILQKTDTDPGDFHEESKWMESIYASAYCVIAASSAEHMSSGFLGHERDKAAVQLHKGDESTQPTTFLCDTIDDFQGDVLNGPLSKRGWVLQERALARRTIFFTNNQTYWECSQGIRLQFLGDSNFPSSATTVGRGAQEFLFEQLYEDYTRLEFSQQTDKAIGISGLEQRLTRAIGGYSGAGMFSTYWGRCLLWKRDDSEDSKTAVLKRIPAPPNTKAPPSWSWMAYEGGMSYLHPPKGLTTWNEKYVKLQLTGTAATSWLYASKPLKLSASLMAFDDQENTKDGDYELTYDNDDERGAKEKKCVIIGSVQDRDQAERGLHYILVVKPPTNQGGSDTWERIGAGKLHGRFIQNMKAITNPVNII